jgi:hypothetical protein
MSFYAEMRNLGPKKVKTCPRIGSEMFFSEWAVIGIKRSGI